MTLFCHHRWTEWTSFSIDPEAKKMKVCMGLCRESWREGDEEPKKAIATMEEDPKAFDPNFVPKPMACGCSTWKHEKCDL